MMDEQSRQRNFYTKVGERLFILLWSAGSIYLLASIVFGMGFTVNWEKSSVSDGFALGLSGTIFLFLVALHLAVTFAFPQRVSLRIRATGIAWQGVTKWYHVPWKSMSSIEIAPGGFVFGTPYGRVIMGAHECDWPRAISLVRAHARAPAIILDCGIDPKELLFHILVHYQRRTRIGDI